MTSNYIFFFVMVFIAYYGLHYLAFGAQSLSQMGSFPVRLRSSKCFLL